MGAALGEVGTAVGWQWERLIRGVRGGCEGGETLVALTHMHDCMLATSSKGIVRHTQSAEDCPAVQPSLQ